jgi:hypothetical protein
MPGTNTGGRIAGMPSGTETQNWIKDKFKAMGVPYETVTIPAAADYPKSWGHRCLEQRQVASSQERVPAHRLP